MSRRAGQSTAGTKKDGDSCPKFLRDSCREREQFKA